MQGYNIVNGMKFCAKCYQEIFGNQQNKESSELLVNSFTEKDRQIAELQKQLAEKHKELKEIRVENYIIKSYSDFLNNQCKNLIKENKKLNQQLKSQAEEIVEKVKDRLKSCEYQMYLDEFIIILKEILKEYQK